MVVHHIEMDHVGPGGQHLGHILTQTGKVGGEDRGAIRKSFISVIHWQRGRKNGAILSQKGDENDPHLQNTPLRHHRRQTMPGAAHGIPAAASEMTTAPQGPLFTQPTATSSASPG